MLRKGIYKLSSVFPAILVVRNIQQDSTAAKPTFRFAGGSAGRGMLRLTIDSSTGNNALRISI
jgi:hypothetical protein